MSDYIDVCTNKFLQDNPNEIQLNGKRFANPVLGDATVFIPIYSTIKFGQLLREEFRGSVPPTVVKIIIYMDNIQTSWIPASVLKYFASVGIEIVEHQFIDYVFLNFALNPLTTYFFIIRDSRHVQHVIDRAHSYDNIRAIYVQCESTQLLQQRRLARNYSKLDAVFDEPFRLFIKITMDIALFYEETADRQKEDASLIEATQGNYQRSIDLYTFAETFMKSFSSE